MTDIFSVEKRSLVMAAIRGRGNKDTEVRLMRLFRLHGIAGWRRHPALVGRPDFVFPKLKLAVFVDGCFWHACPAHFRAPQKSSEFWAAKIAANRKRDRLVNRTLRAQGWTVIRIWEHALTAKRRARTMNRIKKAVALLRQSALTSSETRTPGLSETTRLSLRSRRAPQ